MEEHFEGERQLRLSLIGELDLATVPQLHSRLQELRDGSYSIRLDLERLDFMDSTGLRELIAVLTESRRDGWILEIERRTTDQVRRVIDLVGARPFFWPEEA